MSSIATLYADAPVETTEPVHRREAETLADLLYEGFYLSYLLRNGWVPSTASSFVDRVIRFLDDFERRATRNDFAAADIYDAKYAFCATIDEAVLSAPSAIRDEWERQPLQLTLFGDQLAGEHFFDKLEEARQGGHNRLPALEVFHLCLLLGFKGKYLLEGPEKLAYFTRQLGEQIAHLKGTRAAFAPHWQAPDKIAHRLRRNFPAWALAAVMALSGLLAYIGLRDYTADQTVAAMSPYHDIVSLPPRAPHIKITLP